MNGQPLLKDTRTYQIKSPHLVVIILLPLESRPLDAVLEGRRLLGGQAVSDVRKGFHRLLSLLLHRFLHKFSVAEKESIE